MLELKNIIKDYKTGNETIHALKGINLKFRESEFVSILGPSGCGKTTLLNIIGGLDKYSDGDLLINGKSTKQFDDRDFDTYRNHSVGFVFQSYNLIAHQTVLSNVELALTLSGVSRKERKRRAIKALEDVGLGSQIHKKPLQMSGGQMQRVAIARALVNDPDIILADEPTGALDTETSIQVMNILKKVSEKKLVIMVTHNPELAEKYSTRIIRLLDGEIKSDSMPYESENNNEIPESKTYSRHSSMSRITALSLSLNNLRTKKGRTFLTSFAGSIGIIGIALVLSISNGMQAFINTKEEEALSNYPIEIDRQATNMSSMFSAMSGQRADSSKSDNNSDNNNEETSQNSEIKSNNYIVDMIDEIFSGQSTNDLTNFKEYIEHNQDRFDEVTNDIQYRYSTPLNIYKDSENDEVYKVNPSQVMDSLGMGGMFGSDSSSSSEDGLSLSTSMYSTDVWLQLPGNMDTLKSQYKLLDGRFPEKWNEAVIITDSNGNICDYTLYSLGILDNDDLKEIVKKINNGEKVEEPKDTKYSYDELEKLKFRLLVNSDYFEKNSNGKWQDKSDDQIYISQKLKDAPQIKIVGIIKSGSTTDLASTGGVGYTSELMQNLIEKVNDSEIVKAQKEDKDTDIFTGLEFSTDDENSSSFKSMDDLNAYIKSLGSSEQDQMNAYIEQMKKDSMSDDEILNTFNQSLKNDTSNASYDGNLKKMGVSDIDTPESILLYPKDFDSKDEITNIIDGYNSGRDEEEKITYTDYIGLMMSSVKTILNAITSVLIVFVSISLVVSSIMIAIITYISVLERTKEIGILRAIGASKKNISEIFNAEALIIGFSAGALGIIITILLDLIVNAIAESILNIANLAALPIQGAIILVLISMTLSFIAGVIPAKMAAKKDPVAALRSE